MHRKCEFVTTKVFCITQGEVFNLNNVILVRNNKVMFMLYKIL